MRVIDPGHVYALARLDGDGEELLTFVKREGHGYPGNIGSHPGTNIQEVLRALIDRVQYLDGQISHLENAIVITNLRDALWRLEVRAAERHRRVTVSIPCRIECVPVCELCGHIGCRGNCHLPLTDGTREKEGKRG